MPSDNRDPHERAAFCVDSPLQLAVRAARTDWRPTTSETGRPPLLGIPKGQGWRLSAPGLPGHGASKDLCVQPVPQGVRGHIEVVVSLEPKPAASDSVGL